MLEDIIRRPVLYTNRLFSTTIMIEGSYTFYSDACSLDLNNDDLAPGRDFFSSGIAEETRVPPKTNELKYFLTL